MSPKNENWEKALEYWNSLKSDPDAKFEKEVNLNGEDKNNMIKFLEALDDDDDVQNIFTCLLYTSDAADE